MASAQPSTNNTAWLLNGNHLSTLRDGGYLPPRVARLGIRQLLKQRLAAIATTSLEAAQERKMQYVARLRAGGETARQHWQPECYEEVGPGVMEACLGPRMKQSCCLYAEAEMTLAGAEMGMLELCGRRAELRDGMRVLDLGCGWGAAAVYFAETFPNSSVTAFSNTRAQKEYIDGCVEEKGLKNLTVLTGDVVDYEFEPESFDRVVSIELFEYMKNYELLMAKVARALKPGGKLFVHMFAHKSTPYDFESGWVTEHFFSGGSMPCADLLLYFQSNLAVEKQWWVNGKHYAKTYEDWLSNMTANKMEIWPQLEKTYGRDNTATWYHRWQVFYMAYAELFAFEGGDIWGVSHYLFEKPAIKSSEGQP